MSFFSFCDARLIFAQIFCNVSVSWWCHVSFSESGVPPNTEVEQLSLYFSLRDQQHTIIGCIVVVSCSICILRPWRSTSPLLLVFIGASEGQGGVFVVTGLHLWNSLTVKNRSEINAKTNKKRNNNSATGKMLNFIWPDIDFELTSNDSTSLDSFCDSTLTQHEKIWDGCASTLTRRACDSTNMTWPHHCSQWPRKFGIGCYCKSASQVVSRGCAAAWKCKQRKSWKCKQRKIFVEMWVLGYASEYKKVDDVFFIQLFWLLEVWGQ